MEMEYLNDPDKKELKIEEDGKRRRRILKIFILTFVVVALAAILIPVIGYSCFIWSFVNLSLYCKK